MQHTMMDYPLVLPAFLERARRPFGAVELVSRIPDGSVSRTTYGELYVRARRMGAALQRFGMKRGDRVATLMWNHDVHVATYFAVPCAAGVLHTLNLRLAPDDIAYIANHAGDRFLVVDDVLLPLYEKFKEKTRFERVFVVPLTGAPVPPGYEDARVLWSEDRVLDYPELDERDPLGMCYTSGTTGRPKGVVYSHRSTVLHSFAVTMADGLGLSMRDTVLPVVPQFHVNAWGIPFAAVMCGAKLVMPGPKLDAESVLDLMEREQVTLAGGVPTVWLAVLGLLEKNPGRYKLHKDLRMIVGGSAAPESMIRAFDAQGIRIIHAWGMTEMSPLGTISHVRAELDRKGDDACYAARAKQGVVAPLVEARIVGDQGEAPWDAKTTGELQVRGAWVAASYYEGEDAESVTAEDRAKWTSDGWFSTGDVANICPLGYVKITDRSKDLIKSGGEWISSVDLENALMGHPKVREACVVAAPHPKWVERPVAVVVWKDKNDAVTREELDAYLEGKVAKWWIPDRYVFEESIPRTSAGKFLKSELRKRFAEE